MREAALLARFCALSLARARLAARSLPQHSLRLRVCTPAPRGDARVHAHRRDPRSAPLPTNQTPPPDRTAENIKDKAVNMKLVIYGPKPPE